MISEMAYDYSDYAIGNLQGRPSHGGNEAEIFIIPILGGNFEFFWGGILILGRTKCFCQFREEENVIFLGAEENVV